MTNPFLNTRGIKRKRAMLQKLSSKARLVAQATGNSINQCLLEIYSQDNPEWEWKSAKAWYESGYKIRKGQKCYCVWAKPPRVEDDEEPEEDFKFFPIAYIFNSSQVDLRKD